MIDYKKYYIHATSGYQGFYIKDRNILNILKKGKIFAEKNKTIFLCDPTLKSDIPRLKSAFNEFVEYGPSLFFNRNIDVYRPLYTSNKACSKEETDLSDEVRHNGDLSLEELEFIAFPLKINNSFTEENNSKEELILYKEIISEVKELCPNIPIRCLYSGEYIDEDFLDIQIKKAN